MSIVIEYIDYSLSTLPRPYVCVIMSIDGAPRTMTQYTGNFTQAICVCGNEY